MQLSSVVIVQFVDSLSVLERDNMSENEKNVDVTDTESVASSRSKPSGIRVPTVSRLCQHSARKPSIPSTPDTKSELNLNFMIYPSVVAFALSSSSMTPGHHHRTTISTIACIGM